MKNLCISGLCCKFCFLKISDFCNCLLNKRFSVSWFSCKLSLFCISHFSNLSFNIFLCS